MFIFFNIFYIKVFNLFIELVDLANEWTLLYVDPNNFTEEAIMDALRGKNTSFISFSSFFFVFLL